MNKVACVFVLSTTLLVDGAYAHVHQEPGCQPLPVSTPRCFSGAYVGGAVGYSFHQARTKHELINPITRRTKRNNLLLDGASGGFVLGCGQTLGCSCLYLGLELGYFWGDPVGKYTSNNPRIPDVLRIKVKRRSGVELAARIGWTFNQTLPYIKLGWVHTKINGTQVLGDRNPPLFPAIYQPFLNTPLDGFLMGAGMDMKVTRFWIAGLEYTHAIYQRKTGPRRQALAVLPTAAASWTGSVKLADNTFRLRLAYQF